MQEYLHPPPHYMPKPDLLTLLWCISVQLQPSILWFPPTGASTLWSPLWSN